MKPKANAGVPAKWAVVGTKGPDNGITGIHQRCHLLATEGVKCRSASQTQHHSNPIVKGMTYLALRLQEIGIKNGHQYNIDKATGHEEGDDQKSTT